MGDFKFPTNGPPGTIQGPPRDQDPNMAAPAGDTWGAPGQTGTGYDLPGQGAGRMGLGAPPSGGGVGVALPPVTWNRPPAPPSPTPNGSRFGPGGPLPQGGPAYQPPVRQPMAPPMPQVKPQARPGGPGMTVSQGSASRGLGNGTTPPVWQPPQVKPHPGKQPPPYPPKYPVR